MPPAGSQAVFATTHWSVVATAADAASPQAAAALEQLCRTYWYPLYAYVRRRGHTPEDAQDLTQAFFARLLEKNLFAVADPSRGRFRTFLLTALKNFLISDHEHQHAAKRGGGVPVLPLPPADPEARYQAEPADPATPDLLFERRWALTVLENALTRLRLEYADAGRGPWFDQLKDFVWGQKNDLTYADVARQLDLTEDAVKKSVLRLRGRFRETLRTEISHTVMTPSEVDQEMRHLIEVLRGS